MPTRRTIMRGVGAGLLLAPLPSRRARAATDALRLSMGSPMPQGHPATTCLVEALDAIRRESDGRIDITLYPDSQLGSELSMQSQLRSGAIAFTLTSASSLQTLAPLAGIPGVAYAFPGYVPLWAALDGGPLNERIRDSLGKFGLRAFRLVDNGFRDVITSVRPIETVADLHGLKIRVPPSPLLTALFRALGAAPTTINLAETYAALQTRVADGMENSLPQIEATRVYEVQKYLSRTGHSWDGLWILAHGRTWDALPADARDLIERHFDAAVERQRQAFVQMNTQAEARLRAKGLAVNAPDRAPFRAALDRAGYYAEWKARFGSEAWAALERHTGPLGG
ncbi:tripartite ATP-independent transporter solute receptor, DctP family [Methylobacterium sp. 174MFSha1.1]|uniref:TRAP transporter substrate-binding protein n=1 Tax=Methylobacterium sp. 174MFSha1.1 TaxID=1502749 RepID=UPI0008E2EA08|nr:TRAP transporter substrate-binding protein [Methylobacterium sp. 174MFSha1.1]SFU98157.1 tripartite ATP-independent transporter solute receptor, DctP family [Methylobacterium sp. 174MFSha1.1]